MVSMDASSNSERGGEPVAGWRGDLNMLELARKVLASDPQQFPEYALVSREGVPLIPRGGVDIIVRTWFFEKFAEISWLADNRVWLAANADHHQYGTPFLYPRQGGWCFGVVGTVPSGQVVAGWGNMEALRTLVARVAANDVDFEATLIALERVGE